jgi:hypothetical protein
MKSFFRMGSSFLTSLSFWLLLNQILKKFPVQEVEVKSLPDFGSEHLNEETVKSANLLNRIVWPKLARDDLMSLMVIIELNEPDANEGKKSRLAGSAPSITLIFSLRIKRIRRT